MGGWRAAAMINVWCNDGPCEGNQVIDRYNSVITFQVPDVVGMQWDPEVKVQDVNFTMRVVEYHVAYCLVGNAKRPARDALGRIIYQEARNEREGHRKTV